MGTANNPTSFILSSKYKMCSFIPDKTQALAKLYFTLHPEYTTIKIHQVYKKFSSITLQGKRYGSSGKRHQLYVVFASWDESDYRPPLTTLPQSQFHPHYNKRPINIHFYVLATCTTAKMQVEERQETWTLAFESWLFPHPSRYKLGKPAEVWCNTTLTESFGVHSYVPIGCLLSRCTHGLYIIEQESVYVIIPLI